MQLGNGHDISVGGDVSLSLVSLSGGEVAVGDGPSPNEDGDGMDAVLGENAPSWNARTRGKGERHNLV